MKKISLLLAFYISIFSSAYGSHLTENDTIPLLVTHTTGVNIACAEGGSIRERLENNASGYFNYPKHAVTTDLKSSTIREDDEHIVADALTHDFPWLGEIYMERPPTFNSDFLNGNIVEAFLENLLPRLLPGGKITIEWHPYILYYCGEISGNAIEKNQFCSHVSLRDSMMELFKIHLGPKEKLHNKSQYNTLKNTPIEKAFLKTEEILKGLSIYHQEVVLSFDESLDNLHIENGVKYFPPSSLFSYILEKSSIEENAPYIKNLMEERFGLEKVNVEPFATSPVNSRTNLCLITAYKPVKLSLLSFKDAKTLSILPEEVAEALSSVLPVTLERRHIQG